jgi:hypothetical protein
MSRRHIRPASKHHVAFYDEDWDFLLARFGRESQYKGGVSEAIRTIVHQYVKALREREAAAAQRITGV